MILLEGGDVAEREGWSLHSKYRTGPCERLSWRAVAEAEAAQGGPSPQEIAIQWDRLGSVAQGATMGRHDWQA